MHRMAAATMARCELAARSAWVRRAGAAWACGVAVFAGSGMRAPCRCRGQVAVGGVAEGSLGNLTSWLYSKFLGWRLHPPPGIHEGDLPMSGIAGVWRLKSATLLRDGAEREWFGPDPDGLLILTEDRHFTEVLTR